VSQIGCQQRQFGFDIGASSVPPKEGIHREGMAEIMDSRQAPLGSQDGTLFE
jgi:hypothetical protein